MVARRTLALTIVLILLGVWIVWDVRKYDADRWASGPLLPDLAQEMFTRISIERLDAAQRPERLEFELVDNTWLMRAPRQGPAESALIEQALSNPLTRWSSTYLPLKRDELEQYGLGPKAVRVTFSSPTVSAVLRIGRHSVLEQGVYCWIEGQRRIGFMDLDFDAPYLQPIERYLADTDRKAADRNEE